ncbi:MAG: UDP-3-O-(3-hydroxymyristoyl)glucosamine N-acyltransferase [Pseudomonadota bacterium]
MPHTIAEIAKATGLRAEGRLDLVVVRPAEPSSAGPDDLALAMDPGFSSTLGDCPARAAVLADGVDWQDLGFEAALFASRPKAGLAAIGDVFADPLDLDPGIHPTALIHPDAVLDEGCWIGPYSLIGSGVRIGRGARIQSHVTIGPDSEIGSDAIILHGARIGRRVVAGDRLFVQSNAVIGGEGFSYLTPDASSVEVAKQGTASEVEAQNTGISRINSLGSVELGDDVDIGAGTTIDRGTISNTTVGAGTKIDNQVMLGHNVQVGENCMLCAQVGIAGSTKVGDRVVLGGQVGCADHCEIGSDTIVGGGSLIGSNVPSGKIMIGMPVMPRDKFFELQYALRRLPRLANQVAEIRKTLGL